MTKTDDTSGLGDGQGTKIGSPAAKPAPAEHNDGPSDRPERQTGAGQEATGSSDEHTEHQHESTYGGRGGEPKKPADP